MSWQTLLPPDAVAALAFDSNDGAWDAELFSDVAALLGPQLGLSGASDDEANDASSDLMGDDDLAILNQLLHNAQQHDATRQQQQQEQTKSAPESLPSAAPAAAAAVATPTPTALVTIPPPMAAPPSAVSAVVRTKKPAISAAVADLSMPDEEILFTGKTTRERRKEELVFLRAKAQELEAKLAKLKQQMELQVPTTSSGQCTDLMAQSQNTLSRYAALWMKLAKRQDEERRHALTENAKLRQLVVAQVRLARSLDRVLRKRMKHKTPMLDGESEGDTTEAER